MSRFYQYCLALLLMQGWLSAVAQENNELPAGYYVTIGVYDPGTEAYAKQYAEKLRAESIDANYGFYSKTNRYYVYIGFYKELRESINQMQSLRKEGRFTDSWVKVIPGIVGEAPAPMPSPVASEKEVSKPVVETKAANEAVEKAIEAQPAEVDSAAVEPEEEKIIQHEHMSLGNTEVFLSLFNASNNRVVGGNVQVVDLQSNKLVKEVPGNDYLILDPPQNKQGDLLLIADAFGYRKIQHQLHYNNPLQDTVQNYVELMGTTFVVFFDLVRYRIGDIRALYNVYFYNDAAMMQPESKYELQLLLEMMNDNPNYRIRLHGHTNGNYHGRILSVGPEGNLFSVNGATNTIGSAKDLSKQRAETIKRWLTENGVAEDRVEIKAWGGKKPLYDRNSANARKNVRVEVEILQD